MKELIEYIAKSLVDDPHKSVWTRSRALTLLSWSCTWLQRTWDGSSAGRDGWPMPCAPW